MINQFRILRSISNEGTGKACFDGDTTELKIKTKAAKEESAMELEDQSSSNMASHQHQTTKILLIIDKLEGDLKGFARYRLEDKCEKDS